MANYTMSGLAFVPFAHCFVYLSQNFDIDCLTVYYMIQYAQ
jgi:hypothetical protein